MWEEDWVLSLEIYRFKAVMLPLFQEGRQICAWIRIVECPFCVVSQHFFLM